MGGCIRIGLGSRDGIDSKTRVCVDLSMYSVCSLSHRISDVGPNLLGLPTGDDGCTFDWLERGNLRDRVVGCSVACKAQL